MYARTDGIIMSSLRVTETCSTRPSPHASARLWQPPAAAAPRRRRRPRSRDEPVQARDQRAGSSCSAPVPSIESMAADSASRHSNSTSVVVARKPPGALTGAPRTRPPCGASAPPSGRSPWSRSCPSGSARRGRSRPVSRGRPAAPRSAARPDSAPARCSRPSARNMPRYSDVSIGSPVDEGMRGGQAQLARCRDPLAGADHQVAAGAHRVDEARVQLVPHLLGEVDDDVSAQHQVESRRR